MFGSFKDDLQGFVQAVEQIEKEATYEAQESVTVDSGLSMEEQILQELYEDRERFREEIAEQIRHKINAHMYDKKRTVLSKCRKCHL